MPATGLLGTFWRSGLDSAGLKNVPGRQLALPSRADDGNSSDDLEQRNTGMRLPTSQPSPISSGFRWSMASTANIAHLEHGTIVANQAPLPGPVADALAVAPQGNWGALQDLAGAILVHLPYQVVEAAWHYPLGAVAVIWWIWESAHLTRKFFDAVAALIRRASELRRGKKKRRAGSAKSAPRRPPRTRDRSRPAKKAPRRRQPSTTRRRRVSPPKFQESESSEASTDERSEIEPEDRAG